MQRPWQMSCFLSLIVLSPKRAELCMQEDFRCWAAVMPGL